MAYKDLIKNITKAVESKFQEISTRYNFDNGEEFEIALCELFKLILPAKYGICRGFAVTKDNIYAGDDLIIYDKDRFPTLRLLEEGKFDKKHEIPIEAVYAYLEAKNTLILEGTKANFTKALQQVVDFKNLNRDDRKMLSIDHQINLGEMFKTDLAPKWPKIANPLYTVIISRHLQSQSVENVEFQNYILNEVGKLTNTNHSPDLIIAGPSQIFIPEILDDESTQNDSPFVNELNKLQLHNTPKNAFGIGIVSILYALDNIRLGKLPYPKIINNALFQLISADNKE